MTDKEKIREEVERLKKRAEHNFDDISLTENERQFCLCELNVLTLIGKYIDSLQEESVSEELEEVSKEWLAPQLDKSYAAYGETKQMELTHFDGYAMLDAIEFGAKWKEQQMMSKAIVREVKVDAGGYPYIDTTELYDYDKDMPLAKEGDKVKVIILNDE